MVLLPPTSTRPDPLFPSPRLFRSIVCPCCFAELAEAKGAKGPWRVAPREWPDGVSLVHVDGRAWDATTERWVERDLGHGDCRSEEHTSELQSLMRITYAVVCLKKKNESER